MVSKEPFHSFPKLNIPASENPYHDRVNIILTHVANSLKAVGLTHYDQDQMLREQISNNSPLTFPKYPLEEWPDVVQKLQQTIHYQAHRQEDFGNDHHLLTAEMWQSYSRSHYGAISSGLAYSFVEKIRALNIQPAGIAGISGGNSALGETVASALMGLPSHFLIPLAEGHLHPLVLLRISGTTIHPTPLADGLPGARKIFQEQFYPESRKNGHWYWGHSEKLASPQAIQSYASAHPHVQQVFVVPGNGSVENGLRMGFEAAGADVRITEIWYKVREQARDILNPGKMRMLGGDLVFTDSEHHKRFRTSHSLEIDLEEARAFAVSHNLGFSSAIVRLAVIKCMHREGLKPQRFFIPEYEKDGTLYDFSDPDFWTRMQKFIK